MVTTSTAFAQTDAGGPEDVVAPPKIYSPYVERTTADSNLAEGVYWGDTHLHTSYSTDAGMMGNKLGPEEAYRFDVTWGAGSPDPSTGFSGGLRPRREPGPGALY
jgi:hypothetical protein